jgi:hypothetical protein
MDKAAALSRRVISTANITRVTGMHLYISTAIDRVIERHFWIFRISLPF